MKFLNLQLRAYGPFTDYELEFSPQAGLHLVYGQNEAGKSSTLRAISDFLFGIPTRTNDNFVHAYSNLRIGAKLQPEQGTLLECVRRKGNAQTLRDAQDSTTIMDEKQLTSFLGEVDRDMFQFMFGLDHVRLRQGGEEIVQGQGKIGQLLFAAGAGLVDLQKVQKRLQEQSDRLFKPSGRSGVIKSGLDQFKALRQDLKQAQLSVESWKKQEEAWQQIEQNQQKLDNKLRQDRQELQRLTRLRDAGPKVKPWRKVCNDLAGLSDIPDLPEQFADLSRQALIRWQQETHRVSVAEEHLQTLEKALAEITFNAALLQEEPAINRLRDELGSHLKAMRDRPQLVTSRTLAESRAQEILRTLGRAEDLKSVESLRITQHQVIRIQTLGNQLDGLLEKVRSNRKDCERIQQELTHIADRLSQEEVRSVSSVLKKRLPQIRQQGDLESRLQKMKQDVQRLWKESERKLTQLPLWSGTLDELEHLSVPGLATLERYETQFLELQQRLKTSARRLREEIQADEKLLKKLQRQEREQSVPTVEALRAARNLREIGWQILRQHWTDAAQTERPSLKEPTELELEFLQKSPELTLEESYLESVAEADRLADALRNDADRVAMRAKLEADREDKAIQLQSLQAEHDELVTDEETLQKAWCELWQPFGFEPLSPAEMKDWCRQQQDVVQQSALLRSQQSEVEELEQEIQGHLEDLRELLIAEGVSLESSAALHELLDLGHELLEQRQAAAARQQQLTERQESLRKELIEAEQEWKQAEADCHRWRQDWAGDMQQLGLDEEALPAQANRVLQDLQQLFNSYHSADEYRLRIEGIDQDAQNFRTSVQGVLDRLGWQAEFAEVSLEECVQGLFARWQQSHAQREKFQTLQTQQAEQLAKKQQAEEQVRLTQSELDELCRQADCEQYEQLTEAARRDAERKSLQKTRQELETEILRLSGSSDLEQFVAVVESETEQYDALVVRIEELEEQIERQSAERDELLKLGVQAEAELRKIDGSDEAARKAEECESLVANLEEQLQELAVLRLAMAALQAGMEKHREKNQGPVLARASELFATLTGQRFEGLKADFDEQGQPILMGIRSQSGEGVKVQAMSDGTCDQLYFALRLASLENWLKDHEPIPFIVDDVFLNFDDERALAGLRVLAELSKRTQVIFFTHHQHLVDLAQTHLPASQLQIHELDRQRERLQSSLFA